MGIAAGIALGQTFQTSMQSSISGCSKYRDQIRLKKHLTAYTHSAAASTSAFQRCKAKELRTMTR